MDINHTISIDFSDTPGSSAMNIYPNINYIKYSQFQPYIINQEDKINSYFNNIKSIIYFLE
jgi:hypothetical protein